MNFLEVAKFVLNNCIPNKMHRTYSRDELLVDRVGYTFSGEKYPTIEKVTIRKEWFGRYDIIVEVESDSMSQKTLVYCGVVKFDKETKQQFKSAIKKSYDLLLDADIKRDQKKFNIAFEAFNNLKAENEK